MTRKTFAILLCASSATPLAATGLPLDDSLLLPEETLMPRPLWHYALAALALLFLLYMATRLFLTFRAHRASEAPALTPIQRAELRLRQLKDRDLLSTMQYKEYCQELSFLLREYLESRFHFRATKLTTQEFLAQLPDTTLLRKHSLFLQKLLQTCDRVRYANDKPSADVLAALETQCRELLQEAELPADGESQEAKK